MIKELGLKSGKTYTVESGDGHDKVESIVQEVFSDAMIFYMVNFVDKSYIPVMSDEVEYVRQCETDDEKIYKNEEAVYPDTEFPTELPKDAGL